MFALFVACTGGPTTDADRGGGETDASPTPTQAPPTGSGDLPADWARCENEIEGYSIGYPESWYTTARLDQNRCRWFDPERFEIEPQTEAPLTALVVNPTDRAFERATSSLGGRSSRILMREEVDVGDGLEAIRFEAQVTEGFYPDGAVRYGYVVRRPNGRALYIETIDPPGADLSYEENKQVVDRAAATVETTT